jgi:hypothetical protein
VLRRATSLVLSVAFILSMLPTPANAYMDCYPAKFYKAPDSADSTCLIDHTADCLWCNIVIKG